MLVISAGQWTLCPINISNVRRFRVLNIVDDYSREMVGQLISVFISGQLVARFLNQLTEEKVRPVRVICDNGPEFTSKALFFWCKESSDKLCFIQPCKPAQNAFVESLNGKFRNECLNQHWFRTMEEARYEIDRWRQHYNYVRPHSSLNYLPPVEYAKKAAQDEESHRSSDTNLGDRSIFSENSSFCCLIYGEADIMNNAYIFSRCTFSVCSIHE